MTFKLGDKKPAASGRKHGTPNKQTELLRAGVKSAVEIVRNGGMHPVEIMMEASRFLRTVAVALAPHEDDPAAMVAAIRETSKADLDFVRRFLVDAAAIGYKAAEFGCPKLARIDYADVSPQGPAIIENAFEFVLKIDNERPGRPVNGCRGGNGTGDSDGLGSGIDRHDDE